MSDLTLAATSTAVNVATLFVDYTLKHWGHDDLTTTLDLLASELVGDAVKMTGIPEPSPRWTELQDLALLRVRLVLLDESVVVEVADRHDRPPTPSEQFRALCKRWDSSRTQHGRVVWAELGFSVYELTPQGLPKRKRSWMPPPAESTQVVTDPELLRRIRDGLKQL
jgi:hypothetical protein